MVTPKNALFVDVTQPILDERGNKSPVSVENGIRYVYNIMEPKTEPNRNDASFCTLSVLTLPAYLKTTQV